MRWASSPEHFLDLQSLCVNTASTIWSSSLNIPCLCFLTCKMDNKVYLIRLLSAAWSISSVTRQVGSTIEYFHLTHLSHWMVSPLQPLATAEVPGHCCLYGLFWGCQRLGWTRKDPLNWEVDCHFKEGIRRRWRLYGAGLAMLGTWEHVIRKRDPGNTFQREGCWEHAFRVRDAGNTIRERDAGNMSLEWGMLRTHPQREGCWEHLQRELLPLREPGPVTTCPWGPDLEVSVWKGKILQRANVSNYLRNVGMMDF